MEIGINQLKVVIKDAGKILTNFYKLALPHQRTIGDILLVKPIVGAVWELKDISVSELEAEIAELDEASEADLAACFKAELKVDRPTVAETIQDGLELLLEVLPLIYHITAKGQAMHGGSAVTSAKALSA